MVRKLHSRRHVSLVASCTTVELSATTRVAVQVVVLFLDRSIAFFFSINMDHIRAASSAPLYLQIVYSEPLLLES